MRGQNALKFNIWRRAKRALLQSNMNRTDIGVSPVAHPEELWGNEIPLSYRELLKRAGLSSDDLKEFGTLRAWPPVRDFVVTLVLMAVGPFLFAWSPGIATGVLCTLLTLHNFSRLASLVHASDHGALLPTPGWNNALGNLCAFLIGYTRRGHKLAHQNHHTYLNGDLDSDKIWGEPAEPTRQMARRWIEDLFFVSAVRRVLQYAQPDRERFSVSPWKKLDLGFIKRSLLVQAPVIPVQLALLLFYWQVAGPLYYVLFHLLPLFTLYPAVIRLRSAVEHSFPVGYQTSNADQRWITRSTKANWLERFAIAPLDGHLHFEHHLLPGVPYYNLAQAHRILQAKDFRVPMTSGYFRFLLEKYRLEREGHPAYGG
jgi:fatty acid desaturase